MAKRTNSNAITITRGDTLIRSVGIKDGEGNVYVPRPTDRVRFALKETYEDRDPILIKEIPTSTMVLRLESSDTKILEQPKKYVYDIEITIDDGTPEGYVCTFISSTFTTTEEVD